MKRCAFLTLDDPTGYFIDDALAHEPLRRRGWEVEVLPWRQRALPWSRFEAVVIRSPWDYHHAPESFLAVLAEIERSGARLFNSLALVEWNLEKTYLRELAARGVAVVPTAWRDRLEPGDLGSLFEEVGSDEVVLKPVVGANADGAFRLERPVTAEQAAAVESYYSHRPLMAQPLVRAVIEEGEYSLFYFNGRHSHAIVKTPKARDFRVQEEHGGDIQPIAASQELLEMGASCLRALGEPPLYARVDLVRSNQGNGYWLMELELIEPSLYLRMDPEAPRRFALALDERFKQERT